MKHGFSLVELSIVLVILGLLTGGILAGQSLIRAAELRSVSTEAARFTTAAQTFRDKYFAVPGDFRDATRFWGRLVNNASCTTNSATAVNTATGVCDGDGNGAVLWTNANAAGTANEMHQFWRQLAQAGLIEGTYTGIAGAVAGSDVEIGTNAPRSKLSNAGWGVGASNPGSTLCFFCGTSLAAGMYGNYFTFGTRNAGNNPLNEVLKAEEAWNIDTKMDDGRPATGKVMPHWGAANTCTTSATLSDTAGQYNLSNTTNLCSMYFVQAF